MKDEEIVMSLENDLKGVIETPEQANVIPEVINEKEVQETDNMIQKHDKDRKRIIKDFLKMVAEKLISAGKSVSNFIAYVTTPKEIKKMIHEEAAKEAKLEAKKETIETRKFKMDIVRDEKKKDFEKLRDLSKLAHKHNRTVSVALRNGGIIQFEPVAKGVSIKYAEPHLKPGSQEVVHDFAPIGGVLFRSYNSEKTEFEDFTSVLKVISYERGFSQDLIKESSITNISDERVTEEEISIPEPMTETQTNEINKQILENDLGGVNQMIDQFYPPTMGEQPFFSEKYSGNDPYMTYEQMRESGLNVFAYADEFPEAQLENNYSDREIVLEEDSIDIKPMGFLDSDYEYDDDEER